MSKIVITAPALSDRGGVASYFNGIHPFLCANQVSFLQIGSTSGLSRKLQRIIDQLRFRKFLRQCEPDIVHVNPSLNFKSFVRDGIFLWQAKRKGKRCIVFWHGWDKQFETILEKKMMWFFNATFRHTDAFIVLASEFKHKLRQWGITAPIYIETTNVNETLLYEFDVQKKRISYSNLSQIKILFLARLETEKGVFEAVQAVKLLIDKKYPVCLTISGDGVIKEKVEAYTRTLGLSPPHIYFTGDVRGKDKINILTEHHLYCFPTYYGEGLPTSVLEAMAFGMPVVTRPVGGLVDLFDDGKMGALVYGKSPEEIADCIEKIIVDKDKMADMARYNADYAQKHFLSSVVAKRLLNIYSRHLP